MNCRGVSFVCCIFLLALRAASGDEPEGNTCKYIIQIKTAGKQEGEERDPSTSDAVDVRFNDATVGPGIVVQNISSKLVIKENDDNSRPFQAGAADEFEVTDECVQSKICLLYVRVNGEDEWKPEAAKVVVEGHANLNSERISFDRYVTTNKWDGDQQNCENTAQPSDFGDDPIGRTVFPRRNAMSN